MTRTELEQQAKALGIRGYTKMRMADLQARIELASMPRIELASMPPVLSAEEQAKAIERNAKSSPITHQCRWCKSAFDEREMFKSKHGVDIWLCRNTKACDARVAK